MVSKRRECLSLLNNLRMIAENFKINEEGFVVDQNGEQETNEANIIRMKFCVLYVSAYKHLLESFDNKLTYVINEEFVNRALSDYGVFRSFINNCVIEYNMYNTVGTGNISYFPFQALADELVNIRTKDFLIDYLKCELGKDIDITVNKIKSY